MTSWAAFTGLPPASQGLVEIGLDHLVHVGLVGLAGLEAGAGVGEDDAGWIEAAVGGLQSVHGSVEGPAFQPRSELLANERAPRTPLRR